MPIINILKSALSALLSLFTNQSERTFQKLPQELRNSLIEQGRLGQLIKIYFSRGLSTIQEAAFKELDMAPEVSLQLLQQLARKFNLENAQDLIEYLQINTADGRLDNSAWDSLWMLIAGQLQVITAGGQIDWATVAMGLTEFIYRKFVQGRIT